MLRGQLSEHTILSLVCGMKAIRHARVTSNYEIIVAKVVRRQVICNTDRS